MTVRPQFIILLALSIMAFTLMSGLVEVTIHHKPEFESKSNSSITCTKLSKVCHIQLYSVIRGPSEYYDIADKLRTIDDEYKVYVHLSGIGGQVRGMRYLKSTLKQTGAHVVSVIEGDVYSAHAYLAIAFDEIKAMGDYEMLFHTGSHYKQSYKMCLKSHFRAFIKPRTDYKTGDLEIVETWDQYVKKALKAIRVTKETDRGLPSFDKCVGVYKSLSESLHKSFIKELNTILTKEEMYRFAKGDDVIVPVSEVIKRRQTQ